MPTKEQLARWRSLGFAFDGFYDTIAKESVSELGISFQGSKFEKDFYVVRLGITVKHFKSKNLILTIRSVEQVIDPKITVPFEMSKNVEFNGESHLFDFKIPVNLFDNYDGQNFRATVYCEDKTAETEVFKVNILKRTRDGKGNEESSETVSDEQAISYDIGPLSIKNLLDIGIKKKEAEKYVDKLNETIKDYNINTKLKAAHFLAQITYESARFTQTKESGVNESKFNGFIGRGLIQLTYEENYIEYQNYECEDFTSSLTSKRKLENLPYSMRSAGWFWTYFRKLNKYAEAHDFIFITRLVNGGFNGYNDRLKILKMAFDMLKLEDENLVFTKSVAYNERASAFAWGLWHDSAVGKSGCTTDKQEALSGYKRFLELAPDNFEAKNWYSIDKSLVFNEIRFSKNGKNYVKVIEAAKSRIEILEK